MVEKEEGWGGYRAGKWVSPPCIGHAVILGQLVGDGVCVCVGGWEAEPVVEGPEYD